MDFKVIDLGLVDYAESWARQKELFSSVRAGLQRHALLICRHHPVITIGRSGDKKNILVPDVELRNRSVATYAVERGGDVTYHGPGQLTIYPIFNLAYLKKDIHWFLRRLEELVIRGLDDFGIKAGRSPGATGVWVEGRKIASIGISIRNWISFHGLSVNITRDDLENFSLIRPCGMDIMVTSMESETGRIIHPEEFKRSFIACLKLGLIK
ncbi:MAG: lipoyl(octanoyl) transferase LipB [Candidatus Omnitrophota bacterium]